MPEPEKITSGEIQDITGTPDGDKLLRIAEVVGTENFVILYRRKDAKCQNPKCKLDHMVALVSKMEAIDLADAMQVLAKIGLITLDRESKERSIPSPFTGSTQK